MDSNPYVHFVNCLRLQEYFTEIKRVMDTKTTARGCPYKVFYVDPVANEIEFAHSVEQIMINGRPWYYNIVPAKKIYEAKDNNNRPLINQQTHRHESIDFFRIFIYDMLPFSALQIVTDDNVWDGSHILMMPDFKQLLINFHYTAYDFHVNQELHRELSYELEEGQHLSPNRYTTYTRRDPQFCRFRILDWFNSDGNPHCISSRGGLERHQRLNRIHGKYFDYNETREILREILPPPPIQPLVQQLPPPPPRPPLGPPPGPPSGPPPPLPSDASGWIVVPPGQNLRQLPSQTAPPSDASGWFVVRNPNVTRGGGTKYNEKYKQTKLPYKKTKNIQSIQSDKIPEKLGHLIAKYVKEVATNTKTILTQTSVVMINVETLTGVVILNWRDLESDDKQKSAKVKTVRHVFTMAG